MRYMPGRSLPIMPPTTTPADVHGRYAATSLRRRSADAAQQMADSAAVPQDNRNHFSNRHVISTRIGISFLTGMESSDGRSI
jgi:hypothetical protein